MSDDNAGKAIGHLQLGIASAKELTRQGDFAALGDDIVQNNGLAFCIKVTIDGNIVGTEADPS